MTALARERMTSFAGTAPARGTFGAKANKRLFKGGIVCLDAAGRAMPGDTIANGALMAAGKSSATFDNRTGSEAGGLADAIDVEVEFGVFGWTSAAGGGDDIDATDVGKPCYVVDDQTVALTNAGGTRCFAGIITEVRDGKVYVWMGPHVAGMLQNPVAAADVAHIKPTVDLVGVDGTANNAAPLVGTEARLDAIETKLDDLTDKLRAAGLMA
jgi:hypothetical protein